MFDRRPAGADNTYDEAMQNLSEYNPGDGYETIPEHEINTDRAYVDILPPRESDDSESHRYSYPEHSTINGSNDGYLRPIN